jgi:hypothetical protein
MSPLVWLAVLAVAWRGAALACDSGVLYAAAVALATSGDTPRRGIASLELGRLVALASVDAPTAATQLLTLLSAQDPATGMMPSQVYWPSGNRSQCAHGAPPAAGARGVVIDRSLSTDAAVAFGVGASGCTEAREGAEDALYPPLAWWNNTALPGEGGEAGGGGRGVMACWPM